jgi:hypothetical protein
MVQVTARFIDDLKILPRLMMIAVTVLTYQSVHWYMALPDPSVQQSGLVSVCMGALTGCFGIFLGRESKTTTVTPTRVIHEEESYRHTSGK